jgi:hypothetical protein
MLRIIALVILVVSVIGLAHFIETSARPATGRQGVRVGGDGHDH